MNRPSLPMPDLDRIDLADPRLHAEHDLGSVWRRLRDENPVHWQPPRSTQEGFWALTRYDDVRAVYSDAVRFTSERGNVLDALRGDGDSAGGRMVSVTDGPQHTALRRLLTQSFSPRALASTEDLIRGAARRLLRDALDRGRCDFARDVAAGIPLTAIGDLLGVPVADRPHLLAMTSSAVSSVSPEHTKADAWKAKNNILFYFAGLLEDRRAEPRDDVTGLLATARVRGRELTDDEVVFNCYSLILGGDETTRLTLVGMAYELARRPEIVAGAEERAGGHRPGRRGVSALDHAVDASRAHGRRGQQIARSAHPRGRPRHPVECIRQPRRAGLHRPGPAGPGQDPKHSPRFWSGPAFLPRGPPRPAGDQGGAGGTAHDGRGDSPCWCPRARVLQLLRRHEQPAFGTRRRRGRTTVSSGNLAADRARLVTLLHRRSSWRATKALPLTGTQQGMWLAEQLAPGQSGYHDVAALGLTGVLDTEALHGAAQDARAGHEALRCRIVGTDEPRQVFDAEHLDWRVFDLSALPEQVRQDRVDRCVALASVEPFTLDEGPLWRVRLVRLSAQKHLLVCVVHHLISDGWSHGVLLRTLLAGYGARALGLTPASPPPATGYRDWLCDRLAREHAATASLAVDRLARELPRGPYRFRHPGLTGSGGERRAVGVRVPVPAAERAAFTRTCARSGATAYMGLTGLLALLLARTTGRRGPCSPHPWPCAAHRTPR